MRLLPALLLLSACSLEGRAFLELPVTLSTEGADLLEVDGTAIELTDATLGFADLRLRHHPEGLAAHWVPTAYAHPGHEAAGDVVAELLGTWSIDLLAGPTTLGVADAIEGPVSWADATLPSVNLGGYQLTEDGARVPFELTLAGEDVLRDLEVEGVLDAERSTELSLSLDLAGVLSGASLDVDGLRFELTSPARWRAVVTEEVF